MEDMTPEQRKKIKRSAQVIEVGIWVGMFALGARYGKRHYRKAEAAGYRCVKPVAHDGQKVYFVQAARKGRLVLELDHLLTVKD